MLSFPCSIFALCSHSGLQGEQILGNTTYRAQWNISAYGFNTLQEREGVYLEVPNMTPSYTSTLSIKSRKPTVPD
jgi:hypothetical protein